MSHQRPSQPMTLAKMPMPVGGSGTKVCWYPHSHKSWSLPKTPEIGMLGGAIEEILLPAAKLEIAVSGTLIGERDIYLACKFHVFSLVSSMCGTAYDSRYGKDSRGSRWGLRCGRDAQSTATGSGSASGCRRVPLAVPVPVAVPVACQPPVPPNVSLITHANNLSPCGQWLRVGAELRREVFCHAHQYGGWPLSMAVRRAPTAWAVPELCFQVTGTSCISHAHGLVEDAVVITTGESMWAESISLTIPVM